MVRLAHPSPVSDVEPFAVLVPARWAADSEGRATLRDAVTGRAVRPPAAGGKEVGGRLFVPGMVIDREGPFYLVEFRDGSRCWAWAGEVKRPAVERRCGFHPK